MVHLSVGDVFMRLEKMQVYSRRGVAPVGEYVVESGEITGGGTGHGPHDVYPDGWYVTARKLADDGSYDPAGYLVSFYQSGSFTIRHPDVPVIRKMVKSTTFI